MRMKYVSVEFEVPKPSSLVKHKKDCYNCLDRKDGSFIGLVDYFPKLAHFRFESCTAETFAAQELYDIAAFLAQVDADYKKRKCAKAAQI